MQILVVKFNEDLMLDLLSFSNIEVILLIDIWDKENVSYSNELIQRISKVYLINSLDSIEQLSSALSDMNTDNYFPIKCLSGAEFGVYASSFINSLIDRNTLPSELALKTRDKREMKNSFKASGVNTAKYFTDVSSIGHSSAIKDIHFPLVVKPVSGFGTFNTNVINCHNELTEYFDKLQLHPAIGTPLITAEEYIKGGEYHCDCIWKNGECVFISVSKYLTPRIEVIDKPDLNGSFVLDPINESAFYDKVLNQMNSISSEIPIQTGITHTEFFVTDSGKLYVSEIASRFVGGYAEKSISRTFNFNLLKSWLSVELLTKREVHASYTGKTYGWYNHVPAHKGKITSIPTVGNSSECDWIVDCVSVLNVGDDFDPSNPNAWCMFVLIECKNEADFLSKISSLKSNFPFTVEKLLLS